MIVYDAKLEHVVFATNAMAAAAHAAQGDRLSARVAAHCN